MRRGLEVSQDIVLCDASAQYILRRKGFWTLIVDFSAPGLNSDIATMSAA
jgi:hypothetical protein